MTYHAKAVLSAVFQGPELPKAVFKEIVDEADVACFFKMATVLPVNATKTVDFGDLMIAPRALIIFSDGPLVLDFGGPPPQVMDIRSMYAASYDLANAPDYIHIVGTILTVPANIVVIAFGSAIPL